MSLSVRCPLVNFLAGGIFHYELCTAECFAALVSLENTCLSRSILHYNLGCLSSLINGKFNILGCSVSCRGTYFVKNISYICNERCCNCMSLTIRCPLFHYLAILVQDLKFRTCDLFLACQVCLAYCYACLCIFHYNFRCRTIFVYCELHIICNRISVRSFDLTKDVRFTCFKFLSYFIFLICRSPGFQNCLTIAGQNL